MPGSTPTAGMVPKAAERDVGMRRAAVALALLLAAAFALRIASFRVGLPSIYHSDYVQVDEAAELLRTGSFQERASYPVTHVYAYAAADAVAGAGGVALGVWPSWSEFLKDLGTDGCIHAIARAYTAVAGAGLVLAVYLLARERFSRRVALFAAAIVALSPVHVIHAHQARIHVPGITLLVLAAIPLARIATRAATTRLVLATGAVCGLVASVYQLGYVEMAAALGVIALRVRPLGAAARAGALAAAAFGAAVGAMWLLGHPPGVVIPREGSGTFDNALTLGLPRVTVNPNPLEHFPGMLARYVAAEPMVALGALLFVVQSWRARRADALLAFGAYPALALCLLGSNYREVRYSMSATPFLAILAAAAFLEIRRPAVRWPLAALALAVPLAGSLRYDWILTRTDTRAQLLSVLARVSTAGLSASVEHALVNGQTSLPARVDTFPPKANFRRWTRDGVTPQQTLEELSADLFFIGRISRKPSQFGDVDSARAGFRQASVIRPGRVCASALPDAPDYLIPDLYLADRPGPPIHVWAKSSPAQETAQRAVLSFASR